MNNFDTIVVGGGFSGLIAALASATKGKQTAVITRGAGTLSIGGGMIDLLGYHNGKPVNKPFDVIPMLPETHPYSILGVDKIREALNFFTDTFPVYKNEDGRNFWSPTAVGTLKPTYLSAKTSFADTDTIHVAGFVGLKDFYPELLIQGLQKQKGYDKKKYEVVSLKLPADKFDGLRDNTALDIARYLDTAEGLDWFMRELKKIPKGGVVIMPPVLGVQSGYRLLDIVEKELGIDCCEVPVMPPSVHGLRLRHMIINELKRRKVKIIESALVTRADVNGGKCEGVYTQAADKERFYTADRFIIATGGFFGGGIVAEPARAYEPIFGIEIAVPKYQEDWSNKVLFGKEAHPFGSMGVTADKNPYKNVFFVGRTLGGYDFNHEKSGNGVALATAYAAGRGE